MEHLTLLRQGVEVWNQWRKEHPYEKLNLIGADLRKAILNGVNLHMANLSVTDLSGANLSGAGLSGADLAGANLSGANLSGANLTGANLSVTNLSRSNLSRAGLSRSNLTGADLTGANLTGANLSEAILTGAILTGANLTGANLSGAALVRAILVETKLEHANLTGCSIYGTSVWNVQLSNATQSNLIITDEGEPTITVDNLEIAQFIYLLLEHKKLRDVLNSVMEKGVLLLGRFSDGGLELLQAIAAQLRERKYLPMIFDFDRPDKRDYTETVKTLIGLSRFVIVDLSGPSVPQELYATVPHFDIPFIPILQKGRKEYSMFRDLLKYPWVVQPIVEFANQEHLIELLPSKILTPAEERAKERQQELKHLFNR
jgi:hypothetical protein